MHCIQTHDFGPVVAHELGFAPIGQPLQTVCLYLLESIVIDTGQHHMRNVVRKILSTRNISHALLTHHHEDHSGNAALIQNLCGAEVYAHPYGASKISRGFRILPYQHLLSGRAPRLHVRPMAEYYQTDNYTLQAIHTPGHSKDHTVFYEKNQGWLFSGDLFISEKIRFFRTDEDITDQIHSLRIVSKLDFDKLFCAHRPTMENAKDKLCRKLDFLHCFHQQVKDLWLKGYSKKEIINTMQTKRDWPIRLFTMGNAGFFHMVRSSLEAHRQL